MHYLNLILASFTGNQIHNLLSCIIITTTLDKLKLFKILKCLQTIFIICFSKYTNYFFSKFISFNFFCYFIIYFFFFLYQIPISSSWIYLINSFLLVLRFVLKFLIVVLVFWCLYHFLVNTRSYTSSFTAFS